MNYIKSNKISKWIIVTAVAVMAFGLASQALAACGGNSTNPFIAACGDLYTIEGQKFHDLNNNGVNDSEPGLSGWTITITDEW